MPDDSKSQSRKIESRRDFIRGGFEKIVAPVALTVMAGYFGAYFQRRSERRHQFSISVIRADSAAPQEAVSDLLLLGLATEPTPTPIPEEDRIYTYTALIRNSGDYPEEEVIIALAWQGDTPEEQPLSGPEVDTSSSLLAETIESSEPVDPPPSYALLLPRLNPDEWVSLKTSWKYSKRISVHVRSEEVTESALD